MVIKKHKFWIILILLLMTRLGFLIPDIRLISSLTTDDLALLVGFAWGVYVLASYGNYRFNTKTNYLIIFGFVIAITSSIAAYTIFGQSISLGLRPQRYFLTCLFLYFPISSLLKSEVLEWEDIKDSVYIAAKFQLVLYFAQYVLANNIKFLDIGYSTRNGLPRLYGDCTMITLAFLLSVNDFLRADEEQRKRNNLFMIIVILIYYIFVRQGRMITFAALICLYVGVLVSKQRSTRKLLLFLGGGILALALAQTPLLQSLFSALSDTSSDQNTLIRISAQEFYLNALEGHWFLGCGYINTSVSATYNASGMEQNYLVVDNGIYGFLYQFGLIGLLWVVCLFISGIKSAISGFKEHDYLVMMYFLRWAVCYATNIDFYYKYYSIILVIILIYIENRKTEKFIFYDDDCESTRY